MACHDSLAVNSLSLRLTIRCIYNFILFFKCDDKGHNELEFIGITF